MPIRRRWAVLYEEGQQQQEQQYRGSNADPIRIHRYSERISQIASNQGSSVPPLSRLLSLLHCKLQRKAIKLRYIVGKLFILSFPLPRGLFLLAIPVVASRDVKQLWHKSIPVPGSHSSAPPAAPAPSAVCWCRRDTGHPAMTIIYRHVLQA